MILKYVVDVAVKLFIRFAFDEILSKFVFPIKNAFDETVTKLLAMAVVLFIMKRSI